MRLAVLSRMSTLLRTQSPGSLLTRFVLVLSSRSAVKSFSGSSCHCPTRVTPSQRWWLCCAGTGHGRLRVHSVVQVTLSFLSVSAWCCLGVFQELEDGCQISIQRIFCVFFPSKRMRCETQGPPAAGLPVWRVLQSLAQLLCSCLLAPSGGYKCHETAFYLHSNCARFTQQMPSTVITQGLC